MPAYTQRNIAIPHLPLLPADARKYDRDLNHALFELFRRELVRIVAALTLTSDAWITLTDGATVNTDATLGQNFYLLIGGNRTLANPTGMADGQVLNWLIKQDGTGTRTLAYGSKFKFVQSLKTLSTPAGSVDMISGMYHQGLDIIVCTLGKAAA